MTSSSNMIVKWILFTLIIPGSVAVYIPIFCLQEFNGFTLSNGNILGLPFITVGLSIYLWTSFSFILVGRGTPAMWFTGKFHVMIGKGPKRLLTSGLYKYSRNPMYFGIITILIGEAIFLRSFQIAIYTFLVFCFFHLVIIYIEEPHLGKLFKRDYLQYCGKVRRWL